MRPAWASPRVCANHNFVVCEEWHTKLQILCSAGEAFTGLRHTLCSQDVSGSMKGLLATGMANQCAAQAGLVGGTHNGNAIMLSTCHTSCCMVLAELQLPTSHCVVPGSMLLPAAASCSTSGMHCRTHLMHRDLSEVPAYIHVTHAAMRLKKLMPATHWYHGDETANQRGSTVKLINTEQCQRF
jgi:hypothetical protein